MTRSLRLRLLFGALVAVGLSLSMVWYALGELFTSYALRQYEQEMTAIADSLAARLQVDKGKVELQSAEPSPKRKACPRGTVRTQSGSCVAAQPRLPSAGELGVYYERAQRYQGFPAQQPDSMR